MSKKQEVKTDWGKVPTVTKVFTLIAALALIFMFISTIITIWSDTYPGFKAFLTGLVIFAVSAWIVRTDVLDEDGEIKEKYKKNELG
jgi:MFS superfamily sulfate permease-like transporter